MGRGEYNAATTRVLHFKYNPEAELAREARDARVAQLESENGALKQHIQRLEQAHQVGGGSQGICKCIYQRIEQATVSAAVGVSPCFPCLFSHGQHLLQTE